MKSMTKGPAECPRETPFAIDWLRISEWSVAERESAVKRLVLRQQNQYRLPLSNSALYEISVRVATQVTRKRLRLKLSLYSFWTTACLTSRAAAKAWTILVRVKGASAGQALMLTAIRAVFSGAEAVIIYVSSPFEMGRPGKGWRRRWFWTWLISSHL